ncbi:hypothetical protein GCM10022204_26950 [Microlunatus aurantiacus]|uniref:Uncharacterized protein n=1 Tax=Microlunatus aurantiacus TaxID=446786 RepID=A0ABP7DQR3_9ACTN
MTSPDPLPTTVTAVAQLYAAERTAGQDTQRLDFMIFSILLAYIGVVTGWFVNAGALPPLVYAVVPLPAVGLVAYLVQLMDLAKVRSTSIDYLESRIRAYAQVDVDAAAPAIGSAAEKSVTDFGKVDGGFVVRLLRRGQAVVLYGVAIVASSAWVVGCLVYFRQSAAAQTAQPSLLAALGEIFFWLTVALGGLTVLNIIRVTTMFGGTRHVDGATQADTTAPAGSTPDGTDQAASGAPTGSG